MGDLNQELEREVAQVNGRLVADVLSRAADILDERGWTPKATYRPGAPVTALEAITAACAEADGQAGRSPALHMAALDTVCAAVYGPGARCGLGGVSVSRWERRADQTATEVVTALRQIGGASS